ncbi:bifunctional hydroxymethylpyrimidine kinase/phosphomethylpyrimidine kinase [Tsukamurella strandjordii]|uniref:Bifunctional hydroxymethylpyrimidine kinase/phosphomethylpyrimidine kinase n=1 Tax=Tsukamurella strandjordii TaxID=147577 RepID=A0AA90NDE7_9ACTN|nr:bifunctional hydroxymethylpyrimidine kinase/phosphomethylpyrimidine kinase [Tsukamurella strandjordii]MDP0398382.1 bifunctional hydroxymethylpyrimidine kinase/phosphomethylpyrimidine kinase [Tsukamurella strandjordii]
MTTPRRVTVGAPSTLPTAPRGTAPHRVLTIAGSDSGGGAGIQADMRTFAMLGVHASVAITAITVQNSVGVQDFREVDPEIVGAQIRSVAGDIGVEAAKTGMLASTAIIEAVAAAVDDGDIGKGRTAPLVVDPVAASMHGDPLLATDALAALRTVLLPRATVATPNLDEVRLITGIEVTDAASQRDAARALLDLGVQWALIKGGHLRDSPDSPDLLTDGSEDVELVAPRVPTGHDHGAGDTLAAAITAALAHGRSVPQAVEFAKAWVTEGLRWAYPLGAGHGPVNPLWRVAAPAED